MKSIIYFEMARRIKNIHRDAVNCIKGNRPAVESSVCQAMMASHRRRLEPRFAHHYTPALHCRRARALATQSGLRKRTFLKKMQFWKNTPSSFPAVTALQRRAASLRPSSSVLDTTLARAPTHPGRKPPLPALGEDGEDGREAASRKRRTEDPPWKLGAEPWRRQAHLLPRGLPLPLRPEEKHVSGG